MKFRLENIQEKILVGLQMKMSWQENRTMQLWQSFMPRRKEIENKINEDLFSINIYPEDFDFSINSMEKVFTKWAAIEVKNMDAIPPNFEFYRLPAGRYAVFSYKGLSTDPSVFEYIYGTWLPNSNYQLEQRPHFEILGEKYKNKDPNSEEEIWIPVK